MGRYQHKDHYYRKAKEKGLPSRASFKIEEILKGFPLVRPGDFVIDLGAAPGGWTILLAKGVGKNGKVLAIDPQPLSISSQPNILYLQEKMESEESLTWLNKHLGKKKASSVFSDMSPKLSGIFFKDAYLSYELGLMALDLAKKVLKTGGHFVTKLFPGKEFQDFQKILRNHFKKVKVFEPKSSRKTSREIYLLGMEFRG